jgi:hypothetical protein
VIRFVTSNPGMCNYTFLIDICVKRSVFWY